ncbi:DUF551 domain-containing protein [Enterobacter roggenkampii]|uniref:DUF551 domain-containing protein n=1 Tax=Enterobacter roggenkampii TaxID=1812935 RepID=UPI003D7DB4A0
MSTITKERVAQFIKNPLDNGLTRGEQMELARIALASIEAEPVAYVMADDLKDSSIISTPAYRDLGEAMERTVGDVVALYTAPPAPVSVPECFKRLLHHAYGMTMGHDWNKGTMAGHHRARLCQAVEECRNAMLQGAEPVSNRDELPDGWVACSERMPEDDDFVYIWPRPDFGVELHVAQYGKFDKRDAGWYAQVYEQNYGIEYYPVKVTHWMPLPAAPQREVK